MSRAWMPLYIADYLADTAHLDCAESGAYLHLIMHYWQHGALPNDVGQLRFIARINPQSRRNILDTLKPFFQDGWKHKRIEQELERSRDVSSKRSASASARWSNSNAIADANGHAKHMHRARVPQSQSLNKKDFLFNGLGQESGSGNVTGSKWVPTKRIGSRLFKVGELAPAYDGQPPQLWQPLKREDCQ